MNTIAFRLIKNKQASLLFPKGSIIANTIAYNRRPCVALFSSEATKKEEPITPSFAEKYQLTSPSRWVPLSIVGFGTAFATGLMHMNEEVQILGLFVLFVGTIYTKGGDAIGKMLDESAEAILREHNALEDIQIESTKQVISAYKKQMDIANDIKTIFGAQRTLMQKVVQAQSLRLQHDVRNQIVKRLDSLASLESSIASTIQSTLVASAADNARAAFSEGGDAKLKDDALKSALLSLEAPGKPSDKDFVGELFRNHFSQFKKNLESKRGVEMSLDEEDYQSVSDSVKAVARRDGIDHIPIEVPKKYTLDKII